METKFTPGPWEIEEIKQRVHINGHCHCYWGIVSPSMDTGIAVVVMPEEDETPEVNAEREATARLIATAPEMYEECEAALSFLEDDSRSPRRRAAMIRSLKATLAKARGES